MKTMRRPKMTHWLAWRIALLAGLLVSAMSVGAGVAPSLGRVSENVVRVPRTDMTAPVSGTVSPVDGASERVLFFGLATISGKVIHDPDFGAPPILEISIDLRQIHGKGLRSGKNYQTATHAVLHRPLSAFDVIELTYPFVAEGDGSPTRSALASFGIRYSAAGTLTTTAVSVR